MLYTYIVVADRFDDSTRAYQGYGRQLDLPTIEQIIKFATGGLKPDITIFLNATPAQGRVNLEKRRASIFSERDRIEEADKAFFERVYSGYQEMAVKEPARFFVVQYIEGAEETHKKILAHVEEYLESRPKLYLTRRICG